MFLHSNADEVIYYQFFAHLSMQLQSFKKIVFGSDDEKGICNAIESAFGGRAVTTRCTLHLKKNLDDYLANKAGVPEKQRKELCDEIFGASGLTRCSNQEEFDEKKTVISSKWEHEKQAHGYLQKRMIPLLEHHVMKSVWDDNVPLNWTNNNTESQNNVLKHQTEWKLLKLPQLIHELHTLTSTQYKHLARAITQTGDLLLSKDYRKCAIDPQQWAIKTQEQKDKLVAKFIKSRKPQRKGTQTTSDGKLTVPIKPSAGQKPGQHRRRKAAKTKTLPKS